MNREAAAVSARVPAVWGSSRLVDEFVDGDWGAGHGEQEALPVLLNFHFVEKVDGFFELLRCVNWRLR